MKKIALLLCAIGALSVSCSGDDSNDNNAADTNYLPLTQGNFWVYDVDGSLDSGRDSLYVANDSVINGKTYKKLKTESLATGFFSGALSNNAIRVDGDELLMSGTAALPFSADFPLDIAVNDFTIFKEGAANNTVLDNVSGTLTQDFQGYPLEFNYSLTTTAKEDVATYTVAGHNYSNLKKVETVLELSISTTFDVQGTQFPITILPQQNVVVSTQYYAQNIGVVHVVTNFDYQLANIPGVELPVPQSASETQEEVLATYNVD